MSDATASAPARPEPPQSDEARPFWDATRDRTLLLQWCVECEQVVFYPRVVCPHCLGNRLEWRPAKGTGQVYAVTVEHRPQDPRFASRAPYAVALVELDEGARLMTNIVDCDPNAVVVGMRVVVTWEPLSDGRHLPIFVPATQTADGG
jgi:uncharacterized OB-fold protein